MGLEPVYPGLAQLRAAPGNQQAAPVVEQALLGAEQPHHFMGLAAVAVQRLV
jgi:hypothetical protein